jgi:hypothetical protein
VLPYDGWMAAMNVGIFVQCVGITGGGGGEKGPTAAEWSPGRPQPRGPPSCKSPPPGPHCRPCSALSPTPAHPPPPTPSCLITYQVIINVWSASLLHIVNPRWARWGFVPLQPACVPLCAAAPGPRQERTGWPPPCPSRPPLSTRAPHAFSRPAAVSPPRRRASELAEGGGPCDRRSLWAAVTVACVAFSTAVVWLFPFFSELMVGVSGGACVPHPGGWPGLGTVGCVAAPARSSW